MRFVVFKLAGRISDDGHLAPVVPPRDRDNILPQETYLVSDYVFQNNRDLMEAVQVEDVKLPRPIGPRNLDEVKSFEGDVVRIMILNGFGTAYGDLLVGSVALRELHEHILNLGKEPIIDALVRGSRQSTYCEIFKLSPHLRRVHATLTPLTDLSSYDFVFSTEHMLFYPEFSTQNFYDFFLNRLGLDPQQHDKSLALYPDPRILAETEQLANSLCQEHSGERFLILNLFASDLRSIPPSIWRPWIEAFAEDYVVGLIAGPKDEHRVAEFVSCLPESLRKRTIDLSGTSCRSFDHLIGLIHHMADAVVTPDTSVLHVCGGLNKPCVGIFFSIEPELRIRDYATVRAYCPDCFRYSSFWGTSRLSPEQNKTLEENPEYVDLWQHTDVNDVRSLLEEVCSTEQPKANLKTSVYVSSGQAPKILVWTGTDQLSLADRFHYHLLSGVLPATCELEWLPAHPFEFRSVAPYDLVLLGAGGMMDADTLAQPRFLDLVHAAKRKLGIFGLGPLGAIPSEIIAALIDGLDLWFARTNTDIHTYGRGHKHVHLLGESLITLISASSWERNEELSVDAENFAEVPIDAFVRQLQLFRKARVRDQVALVSALLAAESVWWTESPAYRAQAPLRTLLDDIFGTAPTEHSWFRVSRADVLSYKVATHGNVEKLRSEIRRLLES